MKNTYSLMILILSIFVISCKDNKKQEYSIKGEIKGDFKDYIYLISNNFIDSSLVKNNKFSFIGKVNNPVEAFLLPISPISKKNSGRAPFMLENSEIFLSVNYEQADFRGELTEFLKLDSISGSKSQELKYNFESTMGNFYKEDNDSIKTRILYKNLHDFISQNPTSVLSGNNLASLNSFYGYLNNSQMEKLFKMIDTNYQEKRDLLKIKNIINRRKILDIGKTPPRISFPNQNGEIINNIQFKGKYLLLEFWASWCIPCRQTNPELKKVYNNFKEQKFEILGISIDKDIKKWKTAIKEDNLDWYQVIDTLRVSSDTYLLKSVPFNILLDKSGKIIKRNIKPNELNEYLAEKLEK